MPRGRPSKKQKEQLHNQITAIKNQIEAIRKQDEGEDGEEGIRLAEAAGSQNIRVANNFHIKTRRILKGYFGKIYALHWAKDSQQIVSASQDGKLIVWNGHTTHKKHAIALRSSWVMTCAYSPSGRMLACGGLDNLCSVYTPSEGEEPNNNISELSQHEGYLSCCRFVSDEEIITSSGDSTCILWDVKTRTPKAHFQGHVMDVMSVSLFDDNGSSLFVSGSCDTSAKVWDYRAQNNCVGSFSGHESDINSVSMFPDGNAFGTGSDDSSCRLFDIRACRQMNRYSNDKVLAGITSIDFSKTGQIMFAGYDDNTVRVWDVRSGESLTTLDTAHNNRVSCLGVSSNGQALCTGSWDTLLKIWA